MTFLSDTLQPNKRKFDEEDPLLATGLLDSAHLHQTFDEQDADLDNDSLGKASMTRKKIDINYIEDKSKRQITFSKRKAGILKKVECLLYFELVRVCAKK